MNDLWCRRFIGMCGGGFYINDWGAAIILMFAKEVSGKLIYGGVVILVFAEIISMRLICISAIILIFVKEILVGVIYIAVIIVYWWKGYICVGDLRYPVRVNISQKCQENISYKYIKEIYPSRGIKE